MDLMPFDEINRLKALLPIYFEDGKIRSRADAEDIIDEMFELFLLAYANGQEAANADLGTEVKADLDTALDTVNRKVAGKTWQERVWENFENGGTIADIERIIETEAHRDTNEGAYNTARKAGATKKVWHCMMLPTSRDQHIELNMVSAPIDGYFYTYTGAKTMFPGQFGEAENDVNCLCWLSYER